MCGIFFIRSSTEHAEPDEATVKALQARGPDSLKFEKVYIPGHNGDGDHEVIKDRYLTFGSSVLSLRGDDIFIQPLIDSATGSVFCWNGEAWKIDRNPVGGNDTQQVFQLLLEASTARPYQEYVTDVMKALTRVTGPYAFVFYDAPNSALWYGRDRLGRRSLLHNNSTTEQTQIMISSFGIDQQPAIEVATEGVFYLDLQSSTLVPDLIWWPPIDPRINDTLPEEGQPIPALPSADVVSSLTSDLTDSLRLRVLDVPTYTANVSNLFERPSKVAVLFSGGLDCTILARLAHDILPTDQPIDLLNVAFENPRTIRAALKTTNVPHKSHPPPSPYEACPDRITARSSFQELTSTCPTRSWRFVAIDVPYTETLSHRSTVIKLMSPHNTEMDLSITLALYFAARGQGFVTTSSSPSTKPQPYTTTSRVLLSGLGADELFGGYGRHAAAFSRGSWASLISELDLDFSRIGTRNLGRDDRVLAHWGREVRYPYLDEDFAAYALSLPAWEKVGFREGKAIPKHFEGTAENQTAASKEEGLDPAKMVLRLMAWRLGMTRVAAEKKRAIQFGARTAKMEGGRTKGTDLLVTD